MSMNLDRHLKAHHELFNNLVKGETAKAAAVRAFYDEYFAVMDLPAEFFLQTIQAIFQDHLLPLGLLTWRGRRVDPACIARMTLLTIEGEKDDICAVGQTLAAQELSAASAPTRRSTMCRPASATTASSTGSAGATRSTPSSARSSGSALSPRLLIQRRELRIFADFRLRQGRIDAGDAAHLLASAKTASMIGVSRSTRRPNSCTTVSSASSSSGRFLSRSCSIEVRWAPTAAAPSMRRSI